MSVLISILRGINVSGQKKILMADLKIMYEKMGFKDVTTYIQSGNAIFKTNKKITNPELSKKIEEAIKKQFGFDVPVITRTLEEWNNIIAANPFLKKKGTNMDKLHVTFLSQLPVKAAIDIAESFRYYPDEFCILGTEIFLHIPESYGNTKLSNNFFESKLKVSATTRNWKTVITLAEIASAK